MCFVVWQDFPPALLVSDSCLPVSHEDLHYDCSPGDLHWTRPRPLTLVAVVHPLFAKKYRAEGGPQCPYAPVQSISMMSFGTSTNWYTRRWPSTLARMPRW